MVAWKYQKISVFTVLSSREAWEGKIAWGRGADGSKLAWGVGGGKYCQKLFFSSSFRLPDHCSVLKVEVTTIKIVVDLLL